MILTSFWEDFVTLRYSNGPQLTNDGKRQRMSCCPFSKGTTRHLKVHFWGVGGGVGKFRDSLIQRQEELSTEYWVQVPVTRK